MGGPGEFCCKEAEAVVLLIAVCVLVFLYTVYLVTRMRLPRIPGQIGQYGPGLGAGIGVLIANSGLLGFAGWAALEKAIIPWAVCVAMPCIYCWMVSRNLYVVAFSEQLIVVRDLFGAPVAYRWEDVTACTKRNEMMRSGGRPSFTYNYVMYSLTLPDRVLRINSGEEAGRLFLQVLERRRPDLQV